MFLVMVHTLFMSSFIKTVLFRKNINRKIVSNLLLKIMHCKLRLFFVKSFPVNLGEEKSFVILPAGSSRIRQERGEEHGVGLVDIFG